MVQLQDLVRAARAWVPVLAIMAFVYLAGFLGPQLQHLAGGLPAFDARPLGYDLSQAQAYLAALTPEGKLFYLQDIQRADTAFPPLLALALILVMARLPGLWRLLWLLPIAYAGLDLAENAQIARLLTEGASADLVALASRLGQAKWGMVLLSLVAAAVVLHREWRQFGGYNGGGA